MFSSHIWYSLSLWLETIIKVKTLILKVRLISNCFRTVYWMIKVLEYLLLLLNIRCLILNAKVWIHNHTQGFFFIATHEAHTFLFYFFVNSFSFNGIKILELLIMMTYCFGITTTPGHSICSQLLGQVMLTEHVPK